MKGKIWKIEPGDKISTMMVLLNCGWPHFLGGIPSGKLTWLAGKWTLQKDVFSIGHGNFMEFSTVMLVYRSVNI